MANANPERTLRLAFRTGWNGNGLSYKQIGALRYFGADYKKTDGGHIGIYIGTDCIATIPSTPSDSRGGLNSARDILKGIREYYNANPQSQYQPKPKDNSQEKLQQEPIIRQLEELLDYALTENKGLQEELSLLRNQYEEQLSIARGYAQQLEERIESMQQPKQGKKRDRYQETINLINEGYSISEIAQETGLKPGTVRTYWHNGFRIKIVSSKPPKLDNDQK